MLHLDKIARPYTLAYETWRNLPKFSTILSSIHKTSVQRIRVKLFPRGLICKEMASTKAEADIIVACMLQMHTPELATLWRPG